MKILLYSLLYQNYKLLTNIEPVIPFCDDVLIVDNTPVEERQSTPYNTFIPADTNSSYGKAIYESSKFITEDIDYILWCSQDINFSDDFTENLTKMLSILKTECPGALACALTGSVMSKYLPKFNILPEVYPLEVRYKLFNETNQLDYTLLETIFLFIRPDVFKQWADDIKTMSNGYHSEASLIARVYLHQTNNKFLVYCKKVAHHDRNLTIDNKTKWLETGAEQSTDNLLKFLDIHNTNNINIDILKDSVGKECFYVVLHNTVIDTLISIQNNHND